MTLSGVIALILRYFIEFDTFACPLHTVIEDTPVMSAKYPKYRIPVIFCQKWHATVARSLCDSYASYKECEIYNFSTFIIVEVCYYFLCIFKTQMSLFTVTHLNWMIYIYPLYKMITMFHRYDIAKIKLLISRPSSYIHARYLGIIMCDVIIKTPRYTVASPRLVSPGAATDGVTLFSERELMFVFAICRRPSVCLSSVVCL